MPRAKQPKITQTSDNVVSIARQAKALSVLWRSHAPSEHGNVSLHEEDVLILMLAAFFEPLARSQRTIEQLAQVPAVQQHLSVDHVPRSTLSDALARFRTPCLRPLVQDLHQRLPQLQRIDPDLQQVAAKIVAGDGSLFRLAGEVTWALQRRKNAAGDPDSQVRLNLQVDVQRWTPEDFIVTGQAFEGGEPAAMRAMLQAQVLYLLDRGYCSFELLRAILAVQSSFVLRLKKDIPFRAQGPPRPLSARDREAGVLADQAGFVGVENGCKGRAPEQLLRRVTVWDQNNREEVILLTDLQDVEAWVIGQLYRCRWVIELFLRWLKVTVGFARLVSTSPNGITLQFYVAMICTLLIHIRTGLPVSKYSLLALGLVASGRCAYEDQLPVLLKRERERMLERARLARRRASQKEGK